jgi:hypothetical protein
MLFASVSPRQRIVTLLAWLEKNLAARRAVGDPLPREPVEALDLEPAPCDAAGDDDRPRPQDVAAVQVHLPRRWFEPRDRPRDEDLSPKPLRLLQCPARQLVARHPGGKAEVVLDP